MTIYTCSCGTRQSPRPKDRATGRGSVGKKEFYRAIAEGYDCKGCGRRVTLTMTPKTAAKYGISGSPYISLAAKPGRWHRLIVRS